MKTQPTDTTQPTPRSSSPAPAWTPGPWTFTRPHPGQYAIIPAKHEKRGDMWTLAYIRDFQANDEANARLIAAAPEMAEALAALLSHDGETVTDGIGVEHDSEALEQAKHRARALLARINGEGGGK